MKDSREQQLCQWLQTHFSTPLEHFTMLNGDAGFRRYFRFSINGQSYIAVDAPEDKCNNGAFIDIAKRLNNAEIQVPEVIAYHQAQGFLCLSDLGDCLLSQLLNASTMANYYHDAIELLPVLAKLPTDNLPIFDRPFIQLELDIFAQWLLTEHLAISLSPAQQGQLQLCFAYLIDNALAQPQVFMHRDFHSRNIMQVQGKLALIDFQDAVVGPITYDIVSLLRDCYVKWPALSVNQLFQQYVALLEQQGLVEHYPLAQWQRWFDLSGVQRHVKAAGIFARLYYRDGKPGYLPDIPLTLSYLVDVCANYPELKFLHDLVQDSVLPKLLAKNRTH